ncbi:RlpA-like double-psi beta-barrel-protein domain-containing protein-containing protein [Hypoxylon crocopeplum]|nr:RlpA-like double-psi beta-barrel-protein domain-containing protein-containing protein [Hypoxylon crocopeplum]
MKTFTTILLTLAAASTRVLAYAGDMTYYTPGLGACGTWSSGTSHIVAVAPAQYGHDANPNKAKVCGRKMTIHYGGKSATATVVDLCPECASGSIDVSPAVFEELAPLDRGRVRVTWGYNGAGARAAGEAVEMEMEMDGEEKGGKGEVDEE